MGYELEMLETERKKKTFLVFDFYENPFGELIYISHDFDDAKSFCNDYSADTDGECNLKIKENRNEET